MKARRNLARHSKTTVSASVLAILSGVPAVHAQTTETWTLGASGNWSVASDWSGDTVPNASTVSVDITDGVSTVTLNINAAIYDLTIGAGNTLAIAGSQALTVFGPTVTNAGSIQVNGGNGSNTYLVIGNNVTLSGAGAVTLSTVPSGGNAYIQTNGNPETLTNTSTIQGQGIFNGGNGVLSVVNSGTIDATNPASATGFGITLGSNVPVTNTGTIEATGGGTLYINSTSVTNTGAGTVTASGTNSVVNLDNAGITGGTLSTTTGGVLQTSYTNTLTNVTIGSGTTYPIVGNTTTIVDGTLTNKGNILVSGGAGTYAYLNVGTSSNSDLTSNGPINLSTATGGGNAYIQANGAAETLTNTSVIQGTGIIGQNNGALTVANSGTINATDLAAGVPTAGYGITLNGAGVTNTGTLEATVGGTLYVQTSVTNTGAGTITAIGTAPNNGPASVVNLDNAGITGGTLSTTTGGVLQTSYTNTLTNVTIGSGTTYPIVGNTTTIVDGTLTNKGNILVSGGAGTYAYLNVGTSSNSDLTSNGPINLSTATGGGNAYIQTNGNPETLTNTSTIQGQGIFNGGNGVLSVVNSGTIDATNPAAATGFGITLGSNVPVTNTGTIEATGGGTLYINSTSVTNTGAGTVTASGTNSVVNLDNAGITGGTLSTTTGGVLQTSYTNTLTNVTIGSGTTYPIVGNTTTIVDGTLTNKGNIQISGGGGTYAYLNIGSAFTSNGPINLSTATGGGNAYIQTNGNPETLTNTSTIQGTGIFNGGNGVLSVVNSGTIDATNPASATGFGITLGSNVPVTNTGTIEATGGGTLYINSTSVTNTGAGTVTASGTNSVVNLDNAGITGGTLSTTTGGVLQTSYTNTLTNVTIGSGTTYPIVGNTTTIVDGTLTNKGNILVSGGAGSNAYLNVGTSSNSDLTSNGPINLSTATGGGNAYIQANGNPETLTNTSVIQGTGIIGQNNGALTVANSGTINATDLAAGVPTAGYGITLNGAGVTNTGTLEATVGGTLYVQTSVTNTGAGTITAIGTAPNNGPASVVNLEGVSITGGTLSTTTGGVLQTSYTNTLTNVTIGSGTTYPIAGNTTTIVDGTLSNKGNIQISGGGGTYAYLNIGSAFTSNGPINLSTATGGGNAYIQTNGNPETLTNTSTIQGTGIFNGGNGVLSVVNSGTIDATNPASATGFGITLGSNVPVTNTGTIEATGGGTLYINSTSVTNTGAGTVTASGTNSVVNLDNAGITGGTLSTTTGGVLQTSYTNTLTNVTIGSGTTYPIVGNTTTIVDGTLTNKGNILVSGGAGTYAYLNIGNNLTSNGPINLTTATGGGASYIQANGTAVTFTNTSTIQGEGLIGQNNGAFTLVNSGTINANSTGSGVTTGLVLNGSGGLTNSGTLAVSSGDRLQVTNGPFTNFSGTTLTGGTYNIAGTLEIDELGNTGGEIVTTSGNIILNSPTASFVDSGGNNALTNLAVIATGGGLSLLGGTNFTPVGNFTNNGTLSVGAGSIFDIPTVFDNHGNLVYSLTNFPYFGTTLTGGTYNVTGKLEFPGAKIVTDAANITLTGSTAEIINSATNANGLTDLAVIGSKDSFNINGQSFTTVGNFTNGGTLGVGAGSTFIIPSASTLTNFSGTTLNSGTYTVGGKLEFAGANIVTNNASIALTDSAAEIVNTTSNSNALANFATNGGTFSLTGGTLTTVGAFTNNGTLSVGTGGSFTAGGGLSNFSSTTDTLTGGVYNVTGTLAFPGANIVNNDASITLTGTKALIENSTTSTNGLAGLASNVGSLNLTSYETFATTGNFSNAGTLGIALGSTLTAGGTGVLTQTAGTTTDAGKLAVPGGISVSGGTLTASGTITGAVTASGGTVTDSGTITGAVTASGGTVTDSGTITGAVAASAGTLTDTGTITGAVNVSGGTLTDSGRITGAVTVASGSLFSSGTITGNLTSSGGIVTPGSATKTGTLTDVGVYTQNAGGSLNIDIAGTTPGTQYDVLKSSTAALGGTLNLTTGFTPTLGSTFKILTYTSETGTFATVNGLSINATEEYSVTYQPTDVLLTVVSVPGPHVIGAAVNTDQRLITSNGGEDRLRLGEALGAFNADYAKGGKQTVAAAINATLSKQRVAEHIRAFDRYKGHR